MRQCDECAGFMVDGACPNCALAPPSGAARRWAKVAVCIALSAGGAMTLSACYGGPCDTGSCGREDVPADRPDDANRSDAPSRD